jgi:hypothetical protein
MTRVHSNNFSTTLSTAINASVTSVVVTSSTGFPTLSGGNTASISLQNGASIEIMVVTAISGTTLTVTRASEGTTAQSFVSGSIVEIRFTAASVDGKLDYVAPSTSGNVLTSNGTIWTSAAPSGGASGGVIKIAAITASGAAVSFTTGISSTYDSYFFILSGLVGAAGSINMQVSIDGGTTWLGSGGYNQVSSFTNSAVTTTTTVADPNANYFNITGGQPARTATAPISGKVEIFNPTNTSMNAQWKTNLQTSGGYFEVVDGGGVMSTGSTPPYNAVKFIYSSGSFTGGTITLYGYQK